MGVPYLLPFVGLQDFDVFVNPKGFVGPPFVACGRLNGCACVADRVEHCRKRRFISGCSEWWTCCCMEGSWQQFESNPLDDAYVD